MTQEQTHNFSVKAGLYRFTFGLMMASVIVMLLSAFKDPYTNLVVAATAIPGLISLRRLCFPQMFALSPRGLKFPADTWIRYVNMIGIRSKLGTDRTMSGPIRIHTRDGRDIVIPGMLRPRARDFYDAFLNHVTAAHLPLHEPEKKSGIPAEIETVIEQTRRVGEKAFLFHSFARKPGVWTFWLFAAGLVVSLAGVVVSQMPESINGAGFGIVPIIVGVTTSLCALVLRRRSKAVTEWLCLHTDGIAMMGEKLSGELTWDAIDKITFHDPRFLFLRSCDGARIQIRDWYDCPLPVIRRVCQEFLTAALSEPAVSDQTDSGQLATAPTPAHSGVE